MLPGFLNKILNNKQEEAEYFLALEVKQRYVKAAVWNKIRNVSSLVGTAEKEVGDDWGEVINAADEAISEAAGTLDQEKINKTIFGLKESWIEEGRIRKDILGNLKKLCSELTLTPLGFITNTESILSYIQKAEGTPLTAILLDISVKEVALSVIRVGKISNTKIWDRETKSISEEISAALKAFPNEEVLPSRIILYDGKSDLEIVRQELINFPWTQKASFLHFPKVEILPDKADLEGLVQAGSTELGSQLISDKAPVISPTPKANTQVPTTTPTKPLVAPPPITPPVVLHDDLLGFLEDKDILDEEKTIEKEEFEINETEVLEHIDEAKKPIPSLSEPTVINRQPVIPAIKEQTLVNPSVVIPPVNDSSAPKINISKLIPDLSGIFNMIPGNFPLIIGIVLLLLIGGGGVWAIGQYSKADVKIYVESEILEQEADIIVNPGAKTVDRSSNEIPAVLIQIEENDSLKKTTTGEKIVGEKAKGEATLFNKTTTGSKTFKAGTILIGPDNRQFVLDSDATVPAATIQILPDGEKKTFGKTNTNITAVNIGAEYNLGAGSKEFSVKEFPTTSYSATSDIAFKGGSSRKIKIVAESDRKQLLTELTAKLQNKAKPDLQKKLESGQILIEESIEKISGSPEYSHDTGDETDELSLEDTIKFKAYAYNEKHIEVILRELIKKASTDEFEYNNAKTDITIVSKEELSEEDGKEKGAIRLKISFKTTLIPKVNKEEAAKNISGKNEETATNYIKSLPNIAGFEADVSLKLPKPLFVFPRNPGNIKIEIVAKT